MRTKSYIFNSGELPYSARARTNQGRKCIDIVLSSQTELVDSVKIHEPLGNSEHNQIHFGNNKDLRKNLTKLDWNNMLMNKTAIECWNILKYEIESIIDKFVPLKKQGNGIERNICQKKLLEK